MAFEAESSLELVVEQSSLNRASENIKNSFNKIFDKIRPPKSIYGAPTEKLFSTTYKEANQPSTMKPTEEKGQSKSLLGMLAGIGIIAGILRELWQFIQPIFRLLAMVLLIFLIPVFRALKPLLKGIAEAASKGIKISPDEIAGAMVTGFFKPIIDIMLDTANFIVQGIAGIFFDGIKLINDIIFGMADLIIGAWEGVALSIAGVLDFITGGMFHFQDNVKGIFENIRGGVKAVHDGIANTIEGFKQGTLKVIDTFFESAKNIVDAGFTSIADIMKKKMEQMKTDTDNIWSARNIFGGGGGGILGAAKTVSSLTGDWGMQKQLNYSPANLNYSPAYKKNDFISRPGQNVTNFSPDDTIIGLKDTNKLGGKSMQFNYSPSYNISSGTDKSDLKRIFDEHDEKVRREFMSQLSYVTNLRG